MTPAARPTLRDAAVAVPLAVAMSAGWAWAGWSQLRAGVLPDTDDLMRLQQVRDWLDGQGFGVVTQARLGVEGVPMHWSRLPDVFPAGVMVALRPLVGPATAELAALLIWPALLLAALLLLAAALARTLDARPVDAMIVALLAYPATTVFAPARIDHHNLQIVLLLAATLGLTARATVANGVLAGLAGVTSIAIGMETVPLLAVGIAAALIRWALDKREDARVAGLGIALGLGTVATLAFATDGWRYPGCDGFDRQSWSAMAIAAGAVLVLALAGPHLTVRGRLIALLAAGIAVSGAVVVAVPACLSPYGAVDPVLARLWLSQVAEAQGFLTADPRWSLAYAGLPVAGIAFGLWSERVDPQAARRIMLAIAFVAVALGFVQIRAAYGGAAVAVPLLAEAIGRVRRRGLAARLATRIAATGIVYPLIAAALPIAVAPAAPACDTAQALATLRRLPPARVLAPIDDGPILITTTRHQVLAGPYHRNTAGNLATLRFDAAGPAERRRIAQDLHVDYWIGCSGGGLVATGVPALWRTR